MTTLDNRIRQSLSGAVRAPENLNEQLQSIYEQTRDAAAKRRIRKWIAAACAGAAAVALLTVLDAGPALQAAFGNLFLGSDAASSESFPYGTDWQAVEGIANDEGDLLSGIAASDGSWSVLTDTDQEIFVYNAWYTSGEQSWWHEITVSRYEEDTYEDAVWRARKIGYEYISEGLTDEVPKAARMESILDATKKTQLDFVRDGFSLALTDVQTTDSLRILEGELFEIQQGTDGVLMTKTGIAWFLIDQSEMDRIDSEDGVILESAAGIPVRVRFERELRNPHLVGETEDMPGDFIVFGDLE